MHAVVLTGQAQIALEERPEPVAGPGEVLIRVGAAGICGTDLHAPAMPSIFAENVVLGHEFSGPCRGGPEAGGLEPGQPVVVNPIALSCGSCAACRRGSISQCLAALGACSGVTRDGGMAEFVTADQRSIHPVPDGLTVRQAVWTEPLAVAVRAVAHGGVRPGTTVAVAGAGAIGQLILQLVRRAGAGETLVVETSRLRRDVARACGAAQAIGPGDGPGGDGRYDVVFDCTGAADAFAASLALVVPGGRVVVLGSYPSPISLPGIGREASVVFSSVYRDDREFAAALRLLARGLIDVAPLTTSAMPLTSYGEAFASLRDPERAVKVFLDPAAVPGAEVPV